MLRHDQTKSPQDLIRFAPAYFLAKSVTEERQFQSWVALTCVLAVLLSSPPAYYVCRTTFTFFTTQCNKEGLSTIGAFPNMRWGFASHHFMKERPTMRSKAILRQPLQSLIAFLVFCGICSAQQEPLLGVHVNFEPHGDRIYLVVDQVFKGTAAEKSGIGNGDVIEMIDGQPIPSEDNLYSRLKTGLPIDLHVRRRRNGEMRIVTIAAKVPVEQPQPQSQQPQIAVPARAQLLAGDVFTPETLRNFKIQPRELIQAIDGEEFSAAQLMKIRLMDGPPLALHIADPSTERTRDVQIPAEKDSDDNEANDTNEQEIDLPIDNQPPDADDVTLGQLNVDELPIQDTVKVAGQGLWNGAPQRVPQLLPVIEWDTAAVHRVYRRSRRQVRCSSWMAS